MIGKLQDALAQYEKALLINEKNAETHYNMGTAYKDINIPSKALTHLSRSLELDNKNLDTYIQIAIVLEIQKKYDQAFRHYRMVIEKDKSNAAAISGIQNLQTKKLI